MQPDTADDILFVIWGRGGGMEGGRVSETKKRVYGNFQQPISPPPPLFPSFSDISTYPAAARAQETRQHVVGGRRDQSRGIRRRRDVIQNGSCCCCCWRGRYRPWCLWWLGGLHGLVGRLCLCVSVGGWKGEGRSDRVGGRLECERERNNGGDRGPAQRPTPRFFARLRTRSLLLSLLDFACEVCLCACHPLMI